MKYSQDQNLWLLTVLKSAWKSNVKPSFHTVSISNLKISVLNICTKYLIFQKWELFCVTPMLSRSAKEAYLSGAPQRETHSPEPRSDLLVKAAEAPTTEGIPPRNICFFVLVRKWVWEGGSGGGGWGGWLKLNHRGNFNNIFLPPSPTAFTHTNTGGNEFQNGDGISTVISFWRLPSNK